MNIESAIGAILIGIAVFISALSYGLGKGSIADKCETIGAFEMNGTVYECKVRGEK